MGAPVFLPQHWKLLGPERLMPLKLLGMNRVKGMSQTIAVGSPAHCHLVHTDNKNTSNDKTTLMLAWHPLPSFSCTILPRVWILTVRFSIRRQTAGWSLMDWPLSLVLITRHRSSMYCSIMLFFTSSRLIPCNNNDTAQNRIQYSAKINVYTVTHSHKWERHMLTVKQNKGLTCSIPSTPTPDAN